MSLGVKFHNHDDNTGRLVLLGSVVGPLRSPYRNLSRS
jgi:hypothetical protein